MKTIQLDLYEFAELTPQAKEKAIETDRYINVDQGWWDFIYDDFMAICEAIGITVDKESIHFEGFYSQGDGSAFNAEIDLAQLWPDLERENWKAYAPQLELDLRLPEIDRRVLKLLLSGKLDIVPRIIQPTRSYYVRADIYRELHFRRDGYPHLENELEKLEDGLRRIAETLNRYLYQSLQTEYEYQVADEAVAETIEANEYWFTADGKKATRLESLSFKSSLEAH